MPACKRPYEPYTDPELIACARRGDPLAFDELAYRFRGGITQVAQQILGSRCMAEDVAQEVLLVAFKRLWQLKDPNKPAAWLYAIARHHALRLASRERGVVPADIPALDAAAALGGATGADASADVMRAAEGEALNAMVDALPYDYRMVVRLRYWEEWPTARIASFLSLPITTVNWRLHHARNRLRECWKTYQSATEETTHE